MVVRRGRSAHRLPADGGFRDYVPGGCVEADVDVEASDAVAKNPQFATPSAALAHIELIHALIDKGPKNLTVINNNAENGSIGIAAMSTLEWSGR